MILFGKKDKHIATEELPNEVCDKCRKRGGVISLFQIYFHVLLIPIIPVSRKTASQCLNCREIKTEKFFSENQIKVSAKLKSENKTKLWSMIGGLVLFIYLIFKLILKWT